MLVGPHKCFLSGILGLVGVAKHTVCQIVHGLLVRFDEFRKGLLVAIQDLSNEFLIRDHTAPSTYRETARTQRTGVPVFTTQIC